MRKRFALLPILALSLVQANCGGYKSAQPANNNAAPAVQTEPRPAGSTAANRAANSNMSNSNAGHTTGIKPPQKDNKGIKPPQKEN